MTRRGVVGGKPPVSSRVLGENHLDVKVKSTGRAKRSAERCGTPQLFVGIGDIAFVEFGTGSCIACNCCKHRARIATFTGKLYQPVQSGQWAEPPLF